MVAAIGIRPGLLWIDSGGLTLVRGQKGSSSPGLTVGRGIPNASSLMDANLAYGRTTGQRKSAAPARVTVTSPASSAAKTASSDVSRYGVTPALKSTR